MKARTAGTQVLPRWWDGDWAAGSADAGGLQVPTVAVGHGDDFVAYTLPALGLRRMLTEARLVGEPFTVTYSVLDGASGDEAWRTSTGAYAAGAARTSVVRTVELHDDARTHDPATSAGRTCTVLLPTSGLSTSRGGSSGSTHVAAREQATCATDEVALLPPPGYFAMKFLLALPYPILTTSGFVQELSCFGP